MFIDGEVLAGAVHHERGIVNTNAVLVDEQRLAASAREIADEGFLRRLNRRIQRGHGNSCLDASGRGPRQLHIGRSPLVIEEDVYRVEFALIKEFSV